MPVEIAYNNSILVVILIQCWRYDKVGTWVVVDIVDYKFSIGKPNCTSLDTSGVVILDIFRTTCYIIPDISDGSLTFLTDAMRRSVSWNVYIAFFTFFSFLDKGNMDVMFVQIVGKFSFFSEKTTCIKLEDVKFFKCLILVLIWVLIFLSARTWEIGFI